MTSKISTQKKWNSSTYIMLIFIGIVGILGFQSCANETESSESDDESENTLAGTTFKHEGNLTFYIGDSTTVEIEIEIADTEGSINQGMMNRTSMRFDRGMLFIFDNSETRSFWMKNTIVSLDIIYVSEELEIVSIKPNTTPYSETSISSDGKVAKYVVEVNAGFAAKYGIKVGNKISYSRL